MKTKILIASIIFALSAACAQPTTVIETTCYLDPEFIGPRVTTICAESNIDVAWFNLQDRYGWYDLDDIAPGCHSVYPGEYSVTFSEADSFGGTPPVAELVDIAEGCWTTFTGTYTE